MGVRRCILLALLFACRPTSETGVAVQSGGEILIGEYGSLSGSEATFGQSAHNAIMMAVDEINAAGGVTGRRIHIITEDDESKPEEAANAVTKMISRNDVIAILGEAASSSSLAAAPICQANKVPMITPASTSPKVTQVGDYIFRLCFDDSYQGEAMAAYLAGQPQTKNAAILVDVKSDYSVGLADFFERAFLAGGGRIVAREQYAKGDADFRPQLTAIRDAAPHVLFIPGYYSDVGQIAIQAREVGLRVPLCGGDGWDSPKLIEIGGEALEGAFYSTHYFAGDGSPAVRTFVEKYKERYGQAPDAIAALAYDAARVLGDALERAEDIDGPGLRDAIAATKDFAGVTGPITMGPSRGPMGKKLVIVEIRGGQLVLKDVVEPPTDNR